MKQPDENTLSRMQKLLVLAKRGVGGEAANAERFLAKMLEKHGMTLADIDSEAKHRSKVTLKYGSSNERELILQIVSKVLDSDEFTVWKYKGEKGLIVELTTAEHAEVVMHYAVLAPALERHMRRAFRAFIQSNRLFPSTPDVRDGDRPKSDREEDYLVAQMMAGSERVQVNKALPSKAA